MGGVATDNASHSKKKRFRLFRRKKQTEQAPHNNNKTNKKHRDASPPPSSRDTAPTREVAMKEGASPMSALTMHTSVPQQQQQQQQSSLGHKRVLLPKFDIVGHNDDDDTRTLIFEDSKHSSTVGSSVVRTNNPASPQPKKTRKSWISSNKQFRKMADWAFDVIDTDQSGFVDEKELYSGLLLIHLKLGSFAGPAACKVRNQHAEGAKRLFSRSFCVLTHFLSVSPSLSVQQCTI